MRCPSVPFRALLAASLVASVVLASGCGGGGGGGGPPPLVDVHFPPGDSLTEASSIRVRGASAGGALLGVTVGGIPAISGDGFQTWSAVVPLAPGENVLDVVATDADGEQDPSAPELRITRDLRMPPPASLDFDSAGNRLLVLDAQVRRVILFDLATNVQTLLSGPGRGTGVAFARPESAIFDLPRNRVLVSDSTLDAIFAVDLATGNRTFLTGQGVGSGTALNTPDGMALDAAGSRVLVTDQTLMAVVSVHVTTGVRTVVSSSTTGTGTAFSFPAEIVHDAAGNRAFVRDPSVGALFAVALATGNRTIVVDDGGGFFGQSGGMALDLAGNRMLATDGGFDRVFATDLTTGAHTTISNDSGLGDGPPLASPGTLVHDAANDRVIVGQGGFAHLLAVDLSDGDRSTVFAQGFGSGPRLDSAEAVAFDRAHGRVLVADDTIRVGSAIGGLVAVDYDDGERRTFLVGPDDDEEFGRMTGVRVDAPNGRAFVYSSSGGRIGQVDLDDMDLVTVASTAIGTGESLQFASDLAYDAVGSRLILPVGGSVNGLLEVDETTGNRTIFANASVGTGASTSGGLAVEVDPTGAVVYYGTNTEGTIARVTVATGVRTRVTADGGGGVGTGPSVAGMSAIRLDAANNRLLVVAGLTDSLMAVSLATGNRTELSGPNVGAGYPLAALRGGDVDFDRGLVVSTDATMDCLVVIDLTSGDRVAFSR
jgi:hypothetical protein